MTSETAVQPSLLSSFRPKKGEPIRAIALGVAVVVFLAASAICIGGVWYHGELQRLESEGIRVACIMYSWDETKAEGLFIRREESVKLSLTLELPSGRTDFDEFNLTSWEASALREGMTEKKSFDVLIDPRDESWWLPEFRMGNHFLAAYGAMVLPPLGWILMVFAMMFGVRLYLKPSKPLDPAVLAAARKELSLEPPPLPQYDPRFPYSGNYRPKGYVDATPSDIDPPQDKP